MWMNKTEDRHGNTQYSTVNYCPWCKQQRYLLSVKWYWICQTCQNKMKYDKHKRRLRLI
jgi:hypothetical protein